ncbi:MAG: flagellar type III secretion system pore protein FliP [Gammaproteobacteria bacterium]|jgi:flagellar biosynthetic protein FliP|nr:flagellar type III secretion system pore protein FliP [Gammaproteobacteria bacterium]
MSARTRQLLSAGLALFVILAPALGQAAEPVIPALSLVDNADGGKTWSVSIQILMLMTALTLLPSLLLAATSFTRIVIVLAILRQAIGMPQTPPNQVLVGLALFLTFFIMAPVLDRVNQDALQPYLAGTIELTEAASKAEVPMRDFMLGQTREPDLALFAGLAGKEGFEKPEDVPLSVLLPSFLTSELKTAFQIGFLTFIPFLVIDLVVSSVLMSMGMMMLSPMLISLPFKIMLFVLVDGWGLIVGTLAASFAPHG